MPNFMLLTSDPELENHARVASAMTGCTLVIGRTPKDGARLFARSLDSLVGVVVDLDSCAHGTAWLSAMMSQPRKVPGLAISRLDPRFVRPLAHRHGVDHWLSKPASPEQIAAAFRALFEEGHRPRPGTPPDHPREMPAGESFSLVEPPGQSRLAFEAVKPREFTIHSGNGERCSVKEQGVHGSRRFFDIAETMEFILGLNPSPGSMVTAYDAERVVYRIPVSSAQ